MHKVVDCTRKQVRNALFIQKKEKTFERKKGNTKKTIETQMFTSQTKHDELDSPKSFDEI